MSDALKNIVEYIRRSDELRYLATSFENELEDAVSRVLASPLDSGRESMTLDKLPSGIQKPSEDAIANGLSAINSINNDGVEAVLSPEETAGLEAIILLSGRPALYIQGGRFLGTPSGWEILEDYRLLIEQRIPSIGRIEVQVDSGDGWQAFASGFLVASDIVMTARHVVEEMAILTSGTWVYKPEILSACINFIGEYGISRTARFELGKIEAVHSRYDLALLRIEAALDQGVNLPPVLPISAQSTSDAGHLIYVIGYPILARMEERKHAMRIFDGNFGVKRLLPGKVRAIESPLKRIRHDCTTLRGSSGSCVIDLQTHQVVGLHYGGRYREENYAVALWKLRGDKLLANAGIEFV